MPSAFTQGPSKRQDQSSASGHRSPMAFPVLGPLRSAPVRTSIWPQGSPWAYTPIATPMMPVDGRPSPAMPLYPPVTVSAVLEGTDHSLRPTAKPWTPHTAHPHHNGTMVGHHRMPSIQEHVHWSHNADVTAMTRVNEIQGSPMAFPSRRGDRRRSMSTTSGSNTDAGVWSDGLWTASERTASGSTQVSSPSLMMQVPSLVLPLTGQPGWRTDASHKRTTSLPPPGIVTGNVWSSSSSSSAHHQGSSLVSSSSRRTSSDSWPSHSTSLAHAEVSSDPILPAWLAQDLAHELKKSQSAEIPPVAVSASAQAKIKKGPSSAKSRQAKSPPGTEQPAQPTMSLADKKALLYKTEMCRSFEETGYCKYAERCHFAHSREELRPLQRHPKFKTEVCKTFWDKGSCPYGKRCCFIHMEQPATTENTAATTPLTIAVSDGPRSAGSASSQPGHPHNDRNESRLLAKLKVLEEQQQVEEKCKKVMEDDTATPLERLTYMFEDWHSSEKNDVGSLRNKEAVRRK